jgi:hypothetical protein
VKTVASASRRDRRRRRRRTRPDAVNGLVPAAMSALLGKRCAFFKVHVGRDVILLRAGEALC